MPKIIENDKIIDMSEEEYKSRGFGIETAILEDNSWKIITARQARLALHLGGHYPAVKQAINEASEEASIYFEFSTEWERDNQYVNVIGEQLGFTDEQIDNLFKLAKGL